MGLKAKCPFDSCEFAADSKDHLMTQVAEHAKSAHNLTKIPPDVLAKVTASIKQT